jgi:hypothetical protein
VKVKSFEFCENIFCITFILNGNHVLKQLTPFDLFDGNRINAGAIIILREPRTVVRVKNLGSLARKRALYLIFLIARAAPRMRHAGV